MAERFIPKTTENVAPDELGEIGQGAPRPVSVHAKNAQSLETLTGGEGAVIHDRAHAAEAAKFARNQLHGENTKSRLKLAKRPRVKKHMAPRKRMSRPVFIGICVTVSAIIVIAVAVLITALNSSSTSLNNSASTRVEQIQASDNSGIEYDGYRYNVSQNADGTWAFVRTGTDGSSPLTLFNLDGNPVTVVLYNGAFIIPENLDNSWNVMAWVNADGSLPNILTRNGDDPVQGDGQISSANLQGSNLQLNFDNGAADSVSLN